MQVKLNPFRRNSNGASTRGICCNQLSADLINPVKPQWFYTAWGDYCKRPLAGLSPSILWNFHLYELIPNPSDVAEAAANNPNYNRVWLVGGNEPDLENKTPKQVKQLATAQMDMVLDGDANAKFCLTMGSQRNAFGGESALPFVVKVMDKMDPFYASRIVAFHTHFYAQAHLKDSNHPDIYNPDHITAFLDKQNAGIKMLPYWQNNQNVWLTEIGLSKSDLTNSDPRTGTYPSVVQGAVAGRAARWAFYGFQQVADVHNLWENGMTPMGANFAAL